MRRNKGTVQETEAERAAAAMAQAKFEDYKARWAPRHAALAKAVEAMGRPDSFERETAKSTIGADTSLAYQGIMDKLASQRRQAGITPLSSAAKLGTSGLLADRATSIGIGMERGNEIVDDAYVRGLSQLMAIGRGQQAAASRGIMDQASLAAQNARSQAEEAAARRFGNAQLLGTALGMGARYMTSPLRQPAPQPQYGKDVMDYSDYVPMPGWRP
jgi:hypothetical protein